VRKEGYWSHQSNESEDACGTQNYQKQPPRCGQKKLKGRRRKKKKGSKIRPKVGSAKSEGSGLSHIKVPGLLSHRDRLRWEEKGTEGGLERGFKGLRLLAGQMR